MPAFARKLTRPWTRPCTLAPLSVGRVRYSPAKIAWLYGVGLLAALGLPHVTWTLAVVAASLGFLTACCGHSVGLHRGIIHGAFRMGPRLRRALLLLFCQTGLGGPLSWIRLHHVRDHWQSRPGTPAYFAYRHGLVADYVWNLHMTFEPADPADWVERYGVPAELGEDPFVRRLEATWRLQVAAAFALVWLAWGFGAAAVVVAGRVAVTNLFHWFVGYASHVHGRRPFQIEGATEEGRDGWLLGVLSFGEGFHNTHHALPRSARMGLGRFDLDLGFLVVRLFRSLGWLHDVIEPGEPRAIKPGARSRAEELASTRARIHPDAGESVAWAIASAELGMGLLGFVLLPLVGLAYLVAVVAGFAIGFVANLIGPLGHAGTLALVALGIGAWISYLGVAGGIAPMLLVVVPLTFAPGLVGRHLARVVRGRRPATDLVE